MLTRLRDLVEINRVITSSLDYDRVLRLVVDKTAEFTGADSCVLLLAGDDNLARVVAQRGVDETRASTFVAALDERINVALRELVGFEHDDTFLGVPIIDQGQIRGLLAVYRQGPDGLADPEEEFLITALADQAAIALGHATRYRHVSRLNEQKSRLLETIQSNTTSYLAYLDCKLRFVEVNAAYCEAVGRTREEIIGKHHTEVSPNGNLSPLLEAVRETAEASQLREVAVVDAHREEAYWDCSARAVTNVDRRVEGVVLSAVDVTDRVLARRELEAANRRKDEFLAMLAHELRNPLAAIASAMEVLRLKMPQDPTLVRARDAASRQIAHTKRLLDDLLDVSRITRGKITLERKLIDIVEIARQVVESTHGLFHSSQHRLTAELPNEEIVVHADPERLVQVFSNLLSNAAKFTEPGGRIWFSVCRVQDRAEVRVRDTGAGIEPEFLPFIFDLFVQSERGLDRTQGGLGIGLTLVKRLVEMHGGSVEALSEGLGRGSEFVVRLSSENDRTNLGESSRSGNKLKRSGRRIVLVEDNVDVAETLTALLQMAHHCVIAVYDGPSAVEMVKRERPNAVLLDIGLPGMNGYEVAQRLHRELGPDTPLLVALTGYGQREDKRRGEEVGIDHYLVKPVDAGQLLELLDTQL